MNVRCDLYKGMIYIPTSYLISRGFYYQDDPIEIVPVEQTQNLRNAIIVSAKRGNPPIAREEVSRRSAAKQSAYLKATGAQSWDKLDRERTGLWSFSERKDGYKISVKTPLRARGWEEDRDKTVHFPAGTSVDEVIDRLVDMIQERHRQQTTGIVVS